MKLNNMISDAMDAIMNDYQTILNDLWELVDDFDFIYDFSEDLLDMEELKEFSPWFDNYGYSIQTIELYLENISYDTMTIVRNIKVLVDEWQAFDVYDRLKPIEDKIEYWEISDISKLQKILQ